MNCFSSGHDKQIDICHRTKYEWLEHVLNGCDLTTPSWVYQHCSLCLQSLYTHTPFWFVTDQAALYSHTHITVTLTHKMAAAVFWRKLCHGPQPAACSCLLPLCWRHLTLSQTTVVMSAAGEHEIGNRGEPSGSHERKRSRESQRENRVYTTIHSLWLSLLSASSWAVCCAL